MLVSLKCCDPLHEIQINTIASIGNATKARFGSIERKEPMKRLTPERIVNLTSLEITEQDGPVMGVAMAMVMTMGMG